MKHRRGFTLLELFVAGALLGVLLTICLQLWGATAAQQRAVRQRQTALREAANLLERLATRPWTKLTAAELSGWTLSPAAEASLPDARLEIQIAEPAEPVAAKRITVLIHWPDRDGRPPHAVRLVAWRHRPAGEEAKP